MKKLILLLFFVVIPYKLYSLDWPMFSIKPNITQSAGHTYLGVSGYFFSLVGISYSKAFVNNEYNKGYYSVESGIMFPSFPITFILGFPIGIDYWFSVDERDHDINFYVIIGWQKKIFENERFSSTIGLELKFFNIIASYIPSGFSPSLNLSFNFPVFHL